MSARFLITSPVWTAAGWTMLHLGWAGAAIGVIAAIVRALSRSARPETRYSIALMFMLALSLSPVAIFVAIFEPVSSSEVAPVRRVADSSAKLASLTDSQGQPIDRQATCGIAIDQPVIAPPRSWLEPIVPNLPWIWLCGSLSTLATLATGLIGVEQLRRSSRLAIYGDLPRRCRNLADSLRIARRVCVGICDRVAAPVLVGIVRPLILLPPAALGGWSVEQLEMVLLHELAHVKRWDNLVNLVQRFVESLLFFHPVVWWLSAWVRLERELCCDLLVVESFGQPCAYAEMLVSLADANHAGPGAALAMADRQVLTRIRRLLNLEERPMKLTMPEVLGLVGALVVGMSLALGLRAAQLPPASDSPEKTQQVPGMAADDVPDIPVLEARPPSKGLIHVDPDATTRRPRCAQPRNPRAITIFPRDERQLQIVQLPPTSDGITAYRCRGGIEMACYSQKFGTIRMEADKALIKRATPPTDQEPAKGPRGETWFDEADLPMEVHLEGNAILRSVGNGDQQTVRASQIEYDFTTDRMLALEAQLAVDAPGLASPIKIVSPRIEQFHPPTRQPDGELTLSMHREIRAGTCAPSELQPTSPSNLKPTEP